MKKIPSLTETVGTPPVDPQSIQEGETYLLDTPEGDTQEVHITRCSHGTDDKEDTAPTIISYQTVPETERTARE